jgi:hypothetical protein
MRALRLQEQSAAIRILVQDLVRFLQETNPLSRSSSDTWVSYESDGMSFERHLRLWRDSPAEKRLLSIIRVARRGGRCDCLLLLGEDSATDVCWRFEMGP